MSLLSRLSRRRAPWLPPTEDDEARVVIRYLRECGATLLHAHAAHAPSILIFTPPPNYARVDRFHGVALHVTRLSGWHHRRERERWQAELRACGWVCEQVHGHKQAIALLKRLGYRPEERREVI